MGRMDPKGVNADARAAEIAARQHGVATLTQLKMAGLSATAIRNRVRSGRLHRIHRGVYAVGHSGLSDEGRWMAAVLACGDGAVLSHRSAAELWELLPPRKGPVHVTVPVPGGRKKRDGIHLHRSPLLPDNATTRHDAIAVTTPARTLADLRRTIEPALFRRALRQAEFRGLDLGDVPSDRSRSDLERAFLRLCRRYRLPAPEVNVEVGRFTVDFLWRRDRLAVETDGYAAHRGRQAFEDDHAREFELHALGYRLRRFTDRQVDHQPRAVARAVADALRSGRPGASARRGR
ncbi:MAG: type IV toxin-antitoxin system AbiEi family antitoxin domain-containing protein [Solirubrobacterales bacterium]